MRLDWENEVEVFQQNIVKLTYMLPNMFLALFLMVVAVIFGFIFGQNKVLLIMIVLMSLCAIISYKRALSLSK